MWRCNSQHGENGKQKCVNDEFSENHINEVKCTQVMSITTKPLKPYFRMLKRKKQSRGWKIYTVVFKSS